MLADGTALSVDTLVEGVHWDDRLSAEDVGFKAVAASVSDLAASGAESLWCLLAVCLPRPLDHAWVEGLARGVSSALVTWGVDLIGGDTTRSPGPRVVSVTVGGRCVADPLSRSGAHPGDDLWLTGEPGLAAVGWMDTAPPDAALAALRRPQPPVAFLLELARRGLATAAMDLSDGLASDLPRLCRASGVGACLDVASLPQHAAVAASPSRERALLAGGDDYAALFTAHPDRAHAVHAVAAATGTLATRIGTITSKRGVRRADGGGWPTGFHHFGAIAS